MATVRPRCALAESTRRIQRVSIAAAKRQKAVSGRFGLLLFVFLRLFCLTAISDIDPKSL
jgi:hypothetical protein